MEALNNGGKEKTQVKMKRNGMEWNEMKWNGVEESRERKCGTRESYL